MWPRESEVVIIPSFLSVGFCLPSGPRVANWDLGEPKKTKRRVFSSSVLDTFWPSHMYVCMYTHSLQNTYIICSSDTCCTHAYASSCKALLGVIWQNCMPQECWPNPGAQKADFMLVGSYITNAVSQECWPNIGAQKADSTLVRSYITNSLCLKNFNQIQVHRKQIPWTTSIMWPAEWELGFAGMYQVVGVAE